MSKSPTITPRPQRTVPPRAPTSCSARCTPPSLRAAAPRIPSHGGCRRGSVCTGGMCPRRGPAAGSRFPSATPVCRSRQSARYAGFSVSRARRLRRRRRRPARRDDDLDAGAAGLADRRVHAARVVGAVARDAPQRSIDLAQQVREHVRVVDRVLGERLRDDVAIIVHAEVQLPPAAALVRLPVLARTPLAGAVDLQPGCPGTMTSATDYRLAGRCISLASLSHWGLEVKRSPKK